MARPDQLDPRRVGCSSPGCGCRLKNDIAAWNSYVAGAAVAILAIMAITRSRVWEEWVNLVIGVWLILAPFVLGFTDQPGPTWSQVVGGLVIGAGAFVGRAAIFAAWHASRVIDRHKLFIATVGEEKHLSLSC